MDRKPTYEELEKQFITHKDAIEKISKLNEIFSLLGKNSTTNIDIIVQHTCELLQGLCCLYNRLDNQDQSLIAWAHYNLPSDFNCEDTPDGHICYEVTMNEKDKPVVIGNIGDTIYLDTDPNVKKYGLKSYLGFPVFLGGNKTGALCIVDIKEREFSETEIHIISTLAKAVSLEEERNHAEEALRESEEKGRIILDNFTDGIAITQNLKLEFVNPALEKLSGYTLEEKKGSQVTDFLKKDQRATARSRYKERMAGGLKDDNLSEYLLIHASGDEVPIELSAADIIYKGKKSNLFVIRDTTERKKAEAEKKQLEDQLRQAYKMESIGTLAGGIAHDFNNILGIIIGNTELALDYVPKSNPANFNLEEIKNAGLRAAGIVTQLLSFSRKTDQLLRPIGLMTVIKDTLKLLRSTIPTTIEIRKKIPEIDETVFADPVQINQIIMNLCANASQEMEETGGILEITVENISFDEGAAKDYTDLTTGDYVKITIRDTGPGIDPEIIDRIFDPYFTTKEFGNGSGMGLSVVHGIVTNHNGAITVDSQPGKGTTFDILFPIVAEKEKIETEAKDDLPHGTETILFVDDEKSIVAMAKQMLKRLGYKVETKMNPTEALKLFQSKPDQFDLVITDMAMPQMTGVRLFEKLTEIRSDIPVIISTGHSSLIDEDSAKEKGIAAYVMKPIVKEDLAKTIRKVLDSYEQEK